MADCTSASPAQLAAIDLTLSISRHARGFQVLDRTPPGRLGWLDGSVVFAILET